MSSETLLSQRQEEAANMWTTIEADQHTLS